jgi:hypothetical protein
MESGMFEDINAEMDQPHIQHYISSLDGCVVAGDAVLLDNEVQVTDGLPSKVETIIHKQESPFFGFLVNFYAFPSWGNGMTVPRISVPRRKWTYIRYPSKENLQTVYVVSVLLGERLVGVAFLIGEADILSGRKAFEVGMVDCFFLFLRLKVGSDHPGDHLEKWLRHPIVEA